LSHTRNIQRTNGSTPRTSDVGPSTARERITHLKLRMDSGDILVLKLNYDDTILVLQENIAKYPFFTNFSFSLLFLVIFSSL
jgi:hypothetical protein